MLFLSFSILALASCTIKDSVFDSEVRGAKLWNQKFSVPSYDMAGGDIVRFAIFSDSHQNYDDLRDVIRLINNAKVQFAIYLGDFSNFGSGDEYELFLEYIKDLHVPLYVVPGNHDLTTHGRKIYDKVFGPENRAIVTDFGKLIFWNNNQLECKSIDYNFLSTEVNSANNTKPVFLFQHQDPFNEISFNAENNALYSAIVQAHPKVVVFHGHLHHFSQMVINGVPYFEISRTQGDAWAIVEVDNANIRLYHCFGKVCALKETL